MLKFRNAAGVLAVCSLSVSSAQGDDPFFRHVVGDVVSWQLTPDRTRAVFLSDLDFDEQFELFSVPSDGSAAPVQLNPALVGFGDVEDRYAISADSAHVAYLADGDTDTVRELYCAPSDGSAPAVRVSAAVPLEFVVSFRFTPDSTRLVFETRTNDGRDEIWCAALDGSSALEVSGPMNPGGNPLDNYAVSPDSTRLVYLADADTDGVQELYSALLDGSAPVVKLNPTPVVDGNVRDYVLTPDSARVVYGGDVVTEGVFELYSVPIDGSALAIRISRPPGPLTNVEPGYAFTASGEIIYRADHDEENCSQLYRVPVDGSATSVRLNVALDPDEDCDDFVITSNGYVVYRSDQDTNNVLELYAVPLDGSQTTVKLSGAMQALGDVQPAYSVSPDGTRVVYRADQDVDQQFELYGAPLDGSSPAVKLNPALPPTGDVERGTPIDPSGTRVVFMSGGLYSALVDGSAPAQLLNPASAAFRPSDSGASEFSPGGFVLYRGLRDPSDPDQIIELFHVPLDGSAAPLALHPPLAEGRLDGDILDYAPTADGSSIVYLAREKLSRGLYIAAIDDPASAVRLTGDDQLQVGFILGSDSLRAVYAEFNVPLSVNELFSIPLDASAPPVRISGTLVNGARVQIDFAFTADAQYVVYRADALEVNRFELYSTRSDGSGLPTKLSGTLVANGDVTSFRISPDSLRVVYLADQDLDTRPELYSAPVDGSSAPVKLNGTLPTSCTVRDDYLVAPDGAHAFYRADEAVLARPELFVVPIDGSAAGTKLNGALPVGGEVSEYRVSTSGALVVYRARQDVSFRYDLYSAPSDGSAAPVKLDGVLVSGGNVGSHALTADGLHVVYDADAFVDGRPELFSVPSDGSAAPLRLHPPLGANQRATLVLVTPDGARALYGFGTALGGPTDLYTTPLDASSAPVRLNEPFVSGRQTRGVRVTPDGGTVVYASDEERDDKYELYSVPSDGSTPRVKISGLMVPEGGVEQDFTLSQDSTRVFFIADSRLDDVYELFQFALGSSLARSSPALRLPTLMHPPLVDPRNSRGASTPGRSVSRPAGL